MADYPYMPLWVGDYLRDTRHLGAREHGAYLLLLMEAWRRPSCSLPNDDVLLARWAAVSPDEWAEIRPVVMALWRIDGRKKEWVNKKLTRVRGQARETSKKQAGRAASGWDKRKRGSAAAVPRQSRGYANTQTSNKLNGGGGSARARDGLVDQILEAAKASESSTHWFDPSVRQAASRWHGLGLDDATILAVIRHVMSGRPGTPAAPAYFDKAMKRTAEQARSPAGDPRADRAAREAFVTKDWLDKVLGPKEANNG